VVSQFEVGQAFEPDILAVCQPGKADLHQEGQVFEPDILSVCQPGKADLHQTDTPPYFVNWGGSGLKGRFSQPRPKAWESDARIASRPWKGR